MTQAQRHDVEVYAPVRKACRKLQLNKLKHVRHRSAQFPDGRAACRMKVAILVLLSLQFGVKRIQLGDTLCKLIRCRTRDSLELCSSHRVGSSLARVRVANFVVHEQKSHSPHLTLQTWIAGEQSSS